MSLLSRLFRPARDPREELRPLWHAIVSHSREKRWYAAHGVADTTPGRFDMITVILVLVLLRMEQEEELKERTALLTELFVEDMDGQLREAGVGDLVVGKHIGKLVSVLGGRLGALREALAEAGNKALEQALARNVTMRDGENTASLAAEMRSLEKRLEGLDAERILAGGIAP